MNPLQNSPLVSIVTPSFQQADYLLETLESVARQTYPHIEHLVMDGGSKDGSVDILKSFAAGRPKERFQWWSERDKGQADAINKGLARSKGRILAYLNSDDTYEPETVSTIVDYFRTHPDDAFVHGQGFHVTAEGHLLHPYPSRPCGHRELGEYCYVCQPTAFWRREVYEEIGGFNPDLNYGLDYEYWIRLSLRFSMGYIHQHLASTRLHEEAKTVGQRRKMHQEIVGIVHRHYGRVSPHWIYSLANAAERIERLRQAPAPFRWLYPPCFCMLAGAYFLKWNRKIPLREFRRFLEYRGGKRQQDILR